MMRFVRMICLGIEIEDCVTLAYSCEFLSERIGFWVPPERIEHLSYCLRAAARDTGLTDLDLFLNILRSNTPTHLAWQRLLHHLAIGETYFFRDVETLEVHVLPRLIARRRGVNRLRIWVAGCATGEE